MLETCFSVLAYLPEIGNFNSPMVHEAFTITSKNVDLWRLPNRRTPVTGKWSSFFFSIRIRKLFKFICFFLIGLSVKLLSLRKKFTVYMDKEETEMLWKKLKRTFWPTQLMVWEQECPPLIRNGPPVNLLPPRSGFNPHYLHCATGLDCQHFSFCSEHVVRLCQ